ncbi:hypothetical protein BC938DRAFT_480821 [Jimgerdemannia flammicorona]|uniref:Uncharacterized protein n=1 Tax=Jimgerdemannia flammicorona TaxID=994334 RepID=A0A433QHM8_9FUNG|nr:hypothetical protein BC938DRAFT_480821 [Jimgerdemannia flammicorona]
MSESGLPYTSAAPIPPIDFATESQSFRQLPPETLLAEIARLQNSITHLRRSNVELLQFDPNDPDFSRAVAENLEIIARQEARIETILSVIREVLGDVAEHAVRGTMLESTATNRTFLNSQTAPAPTVHTQTEGVSAVVDLHRPEPTPPFTSEALLTETLQTLPAPVPGLISVTDIDEQGEGVYL